MHSVFGFIPAFQSVLKSNPTFELIRLEQREKHGADFKAVKKSCIIEVRELDKVIQRELKLFVASKKKHVCHP